MKVIPNITITIFGTLTDLGDVSPSPTLSGDDIVRHSLLLLSGLPF